MNKNRTIKALSALSPFLATKKGTWRYALFLCALATIFSINFLCASEPDVRASLPTQHTAQDLSIAPQVGTTPKAKRTVHFHHNPAPTEGLTRQSAIAAKLKQERRDKQQRRQIAARAQLQAAQRNMHSPTATLSDDDALLEKQREEKLPAASQVMEFENDEPVEEKSLAEKQEAHMKMLQDSRIVPFIKLSQMPLAELSATLPQHVTYLSTMYREELRAFVRFVLETLLEEQILIDQTVLIHNLDRQIQALNSVGTFHPQAFQNLVQEFLDKYEYTIPPAPSAPVRTGGAAAFGSGLVEWNLDEE